MSSRNYALSFRMAAVCAVTLAATACLPVLPGEEHDLRGKDVRVTFLHTSDIHSRLIPYDYAPIKTDMDLGIIPDLGPFGGATRIASIVKRERMRADRLIHLDSGDSFQGAPIFNQSSGEVEFKFLSLIGLDAAVVGNHEFDAGGKNFTEQARDYATFPLLAANYIWDSYRDAGNNGAALYTAPYTIKNLKGLKVAIIGMANISSLNSIVEGGNSLQVTPWEQNEALRAYVDMLRPVVDLITITSHLGLHEDQELVNGYDAFFEYGRIREFVEREHTPWQVLEVFNEAPGTPPEDDTVVRVWIPGISGIDIIFGGHLHVVLNPPQTLQDPSGRKVLLVHSGAFAKFMGRLDAVIEVPSGNEAPEILADQAEVVSHDYRVFPIDGAWCDDAIRNYYAGNFWDPGTFGDVQRVRDAVAACSAQENPDAHRLLQPYIIALTHNFQLSSIFAYAPRDIARRNNSTGGDSPLGNIAADSMRVRQRVNAELALTNTLGIRDNLYAGPLTQESMFNVFPFENTINIMYLSGVEMQELFDFVATRSAERGCQSQAQISGARFTMDCAQAQLNNLRLPCDTEANVADFCPQEDREGRSPWQCLEDVSGKRCWASPAIDISINNAPLDLNATYKIAVNDYIAKGGSGFSVLKRNTTRIETNIPLRDSLIGYMQRFCSCDEILTDRRHPDDDTVVVGEQGNPCGVLIDNHWTVEPQIRAACESTKLFSDAINLEIGTCTCADVIGGNTEACGTIDETMTAACVLPNNGPTLGRCSCADVLRNDTNACGFITQETRAFCGNPMEMSIALGVEDGRIGRRLK